MTDEQTPQPAPPIPEHPFTNSHPDRDCVVCGKPKTAHEKPKAPAGEDATTFFRRKG